MVALYVLQPIVDVPGGNSDLYGMVKGPLHDVSCKPYLTVVATSPDPQFLIGHMGLNMGMFCDPQTISYRMPEYCFRILDGGCPSNRRDTIKNLLI